MVGYTVNFKVEVNVSWQSIVVKCNIESEEREHNL